MLCYRCCCCRRHVYNLLGLGSVSYYTMLRVPCPVVVVKGDES
jgi:nucleotide-binding universal stress UspA family protein